MSDTRPTALALDPRASGVVIGGLSRGTVAFGSVTVDGPGWGAGGLGVFVARFVEPPDIAVGLTIARAGSRLTLSWPTSATGFALESAETLGQEPWAPVSATAVVEGDQNVVTVDIGAGPRFYRLKKP